MKETKVCCFTGHRPNRLPWGEHEKGEGFEAFRERLKHQIEVAILGGVSHFICGMAEGIDLLCGELVLQLKRSYTYITLEVAIPWPNQSDKFSRRNKSRWLGLRHNANKVTIVCRYWRKNVFERRNQYMVDNSDLLIAVCRNMTSGAGQTIRMAERRGIPIIRVEVSEK